MTIAAAQAFDIARLRAEWERLHALDAEPLPEDDAVLQAWALFHAGRFEQAEAAGLALGAAGMCVANSALAVRAELLEQSEKARQQAWSRLHERARAHAAEHPGQASAWFWQGFALARYARGIDVARALAQGLGEQIGSALKAALTLAPRHAWAHVTLGSLQAEAIDRVGALVAAMNYGASREAALRHFETARALAPDSALVMLEHAGALLMLDDPAHGPEAVRLQERAAALSARDAPEQLWIELARAQLAL